MQDDDLRRALRRREAPEGFAERALERIRAERLRADVPGGRREPSRLRAWLAAGLAVAASAVVTVGVVREEAARRDAQARVAAQHLEVALQITSDALQHVQRQVTHIGEGQ
ncbi:MAG TPA: hypothetical protein VHZ73_00275 [Vicinamibacterales bacterium]|jgi:hypothetical protein|nr:hypothetical protein [Vicinamibacterales bacterium]